MLLYVCLQFRIICRVKFIPFEHELKYTLAHASQINSAFEMAPAALPHLIFIGKLLVNARPETMQQFMDFVESLVPGVDSRLLMEYTVTMAAAMAVICSSVLHV